VKNTRYRVERLSPENMPLLVQLYQQVFKKKATVEFFRKKYATKSFGAEHIGYLAFDKNNFPAAFYGVIPCLFQIGSKDILAAQSADTMTHENHRNRGLFVQLAQKTYELAKANNIKFIFGFPNENSYRGLIKLEWHFVPEKLKLFTLKASWLPYAKVLFKSKLLSNIYHQLTKFLLSDKTAERTIFPNKSFNCMMRDEPFISYKKSNETFFSRFEGQDIWIKIDGLFKVGFVQFHQQVDSGKFKKKIKTMASILGCSQVCFITHKDSPLYNALIRVIQPVDSYSIGFYNLTNEKFQFDQIGFEYCDIDTF
jgi:hypothetical protein